MCRVDSLLAEVLDGCGAEQIAADARDHKNVGTAQARGHSLVRSLAAETKVELLSEDRLSRFGKLIRECGEINIGAANYGNARAFGHRFSGPAYQLNGGRQESMQRSTAMSMVTEYWQREYWKGRRASDAFTL